MVSIRPMLGSRAHLPPRVREGSRNRAHRTLSASGTRVIEASMMTEWPL